jgi:xyloglucan-specific endo-beta-1,4-glucanase
LQNPKYNDVLTTRLRLNLYGGIWPITESPTGDPVETVTIAGYSWDLYTGWNGDMRVYSFLPADGPVNSFSADVMDFFGFLSDNYDYPASSQYMLSKLPI